MREHTKLKAGGTHQYCIRESLLAVQRQPTVACLEIVKRLVPIAEQSLLVERSVGTAVDCSVLRGGGVARSGGVFKPTLT